MIPFRCLLLAAALALAASAMATEPLMDYIHKPDSSYTWKPLSESELPDGGTMSEIELTSQVWQGITWKHHLGAFRPKAMRENPTALLFITGNYNPREAEGFERAATVLRRPAFVLWDVPNQPLFDGRTEDALISYSFEQYLKTHDPNWPLLFPMTKAAVRAMDAAQAFAKASWKTEIPGFVVSGGSKRGWTTWLTGVVDPRAHGIAPMSINTLNFGPQMKHQLETWGKYSEQIADYSSKGLTEQKTEWDRRLSAMVDPYAYRSRLRMPKLMVTGTNDRYWPLDASLLYFKDLAGPKSLLYDPNSGHGLDDRERAVRALAAFWAHVAENRPMPNLRWTYRPPRAGGADLEIRPGDSPTAVRLWRSAAPTRDFREAKWTSSPLEGADGVFTGRLDAPSYGYAALFGEVEYSDEAGPYTLSTQVRIVGPAPESPR